MRIDASSSSMMYRHYADIVQQWRMQGLSGAEMPEQAEATVRSSYAAMAQQVETRQETQAQQVAPSMEIGDRAADASGFSPPGGRNSNPSELLRLLGANTQGSNAASSPNGADTTRENFWNEILKTFSDSGSYESAMADGKNDNFGSYMKNMLLRTYGM